MARFEYLAIAFGLLYTVTAMRLLSGIPSAFQASRRSWLYLAFLAFTLTAVAISFWNFWQLQSTSWTLSKFLLALTIPGVLYVLAATLVPQHAPESLLWSDHFFVVRRRYFITFVCFGLLIVVTSKVLLGVPWLHPSRIGHLTLVAIGLIGALSTNRKVLGGLAVVGLLVAGLAISSTAT